MLRAGRFTAAILMVAVGVGLIVDLAKGTSYLANLLVYWPILLIMLGAEYLIMNLFTAGGQRQLRLDIGALVLAFLISGAVVLLVQGKSALSNLDIELSSDGLGQLIDQVSEQFREGGPYMGGTPFAKPMQQADWRDGLEKIVVSNSNGRVTLVAGDVDKIEVETTVYVAKGAGRRAEGIAERSVVSMDTKGDTLRIETQGEPYWMLFMRLKPRMDLHITVPEQLQADYELNLNNGAVEADGLQTLGVMRVETKNGNITVSHLDGKAELHTKNGRISVQHQEGDLKLKTHNGRIEVTDVLGDVDLDTNNGTVIVRNVEGSLNGKTSNGKIELAHVNGSVQVVTKNGSIEMEDLSRQATARTSNGNISVTSSVVGGDWNLKSGNGNISLRVPRDGDFKVEGRSKGEVSTDLGLDVKNRRINGSVGKGIHSIQLDSDGKVEIMALK